MSLREEQIVSYHRVVSEYPTVLKYKEEILVNEDTLPPTGIPNSILTKIKPLVQSYKNSDSFIIYKWFWFKFVGSICTLDCTVLYTF